MLLTLLKLCLIRFVGCIGALAEDCLQPLVKLLHLASTSRPGAERFRDIYISMRALRSLSSCSRLGLLNFVDGVHPILQKIKSSDPLNHEHEVRGIGQPLLPSSILNLNSVHINLGTLNLSPHSESSQHISHIAINI